MAMKPLGMTQDYNRWTRQQVRQGQSFYGHWRTQPLKSKPSLAEVLQPHLFQPSLSFLSQTLLINDQRISLQPRRLVLLLHMVQFHPHGFSELDRAVSLPPKFALIALG